MAKLELTLLLMVAIFSHNAQANLGAWKESMDNVYASMKDLKYDTVRFIQTLLTGKKSNFGRPPPPATLVAVPPPLPPPLPPMMIGAPPIGASIYGMATPGMPPRFPPPYPSPRQRPPLAKPQEQGNWLSDFLGLSGEINVNVEMDDDTFQKLVNRQ